jgi:pimeloyl-ACP methyl ester carboxylesterase
MTALHVTIWGDAGADAPSVVLVHGTMTWGTACFEAQHTLARYYRLLVMDRRGFGESPDIDQSDYEVDASDVAELLGDGAHLVGHSYGGVVAMLAAGLRPPIVRSLTLIEPSAFRLAARDPTVAAALERMRKGVQNLPEGMSAEEYLRLSTEPLGIDVPAPTLLTLRAARSAMRERPSWEAEVPVEPLARASWPKLVISGIWENVSSEYRAFAGEPLMACARITADRIGASLLRVPGAGHEPHKEQPEFVNAALRDLWEGRPISR